MRGAGMSLDRWKIAKAERVPSLEGSTCAIATRDGVASPGSMAGSRMNSVRRNMRGPTGSARLVSGGGWRPGVGLVHSTDDAVERNEARRGKGSARKEPARGWAGPDTEPDHPASQSRTGERDGPFGRPNSVHCPVPSGSPAHLVQLPAKAKPEEPAHGLGLVRRRDVPLPLAPASDHSPLDTKSGSMRMTSGKSRVREIRMPGSVRAKPNGRATRPLTAGLARMEEFAGRALRRPPERFPEWYSPLVRRTNSEVPELETVL